MQPVLLFDIGGILFIAGLLNFLYFGFAPRFKNANKNGRNGVMTICFLIFTVGSILMLIAHYLVEGHPSAI